MTRDTKHIVKGEDLILSPHKAIFWPRKSMLIIGDLHLGKVDHFRKAGIAVPSNGNERNWSKLTALCAQYEPERILFLGDLFNSVKNKEYERLSRFINKYPKINFELVIGNHDVLKNEMYEELRIELHDPTLIEEPFIFSHEPIDQGDAGYLFYAHIHPAVKFRGQAYQSLTLACFHFTDSAAVLPAFGNFTGMHPIKPERSDEVFVVLEDKVLKV